MKRIKGRSCRRNFCAGDPGRVTEEHIRNYIDGHDREPPDPDFTVEE